MPNPLQYLTRLKRWLLILLQVIFSVVGQVGGTILVRFYYEKGGSSAWMASLVSSSGFPILSVIYFFMRVASSDENESYSLPLLITMYLMLGIILVAANLLYSISLSYLSASTFALISTSQIAFTSIFSFFINSQKMTVLILNSVVLLALSSSLIGVNSSSDTPSGVSHDDYTVGIFAGLASSALYSLFYSVSQWTFEKVRKRDTYYVILELLICTAFIATVLTLVGFSVSGQWKTITSEMKRFETGEVSYVMTLIWASISWQLCGIGQIGLVFIVSSLFSNAINMASFVMVPMVAVMIFHDQMNGVKIIAMLTAFWGLFSYVYQHYMDDDEERRKKKDEVNNGVYCLVARE